MSEKSAVETETDEATVKREKLRKRFESKSRWSPIRKGPIGAGIYAMLLYPRVFFGHMILRNPSHPVTIYQETLIRTLKWSMDSTLKAMHKSGSFIELLNKTFLCTEKFYPLNENVKIQLGGIEGYWLGPISYKQKESEATILYLHGGGYIALSSLVGLSALCYILKKLRKRYDKHVRVLAIDYSLAPDDPFPTGLNCAERTYRWLVNCGIAGSKNVFVLGDSAGGGLALALMQKLYSDNPTDNDVIPLPLGSILVSPWVELSCDSLSYFTNAKYDWLAGHFAPFAAEYYIFGKEGRKRGQSQQQPKKKDKVMDWLEKVEVNLDYADVKRLSYELNKRLSDSSLSDNQRSVKTKRSSVKMERRAKRRSRVRSGTIDTDISTSTVQVNEPGETLRKNRECWVCSTSDKDKIRYSRIIEENPYRDPLISPLHIPYHILAKFPPLFISYGGKEIFRDDIEMFIQKCIESKKVYSSLFDNDSVADNLLDGQHPDIVVEMDEDMVHDYPMFKEVFGKHARRSLGRIVHFIANKIPQTLPNPNVLQRDPSDPSVPSNYSDSIEDSTFIPNSRKIPATYVVNDA